MDCEGGIDVFVVGGNYGLVEGLYLMVEEFVVVDVRFFLYVRGSEIGIYFIVLWLMGIGLVVINLLRVRVIEGRNFILFVFVGCMVK